MQRSASTATTGACVARSSHGTAATRPTATTEATATGTAHDDSSGGTRNRMNGSSDRSGTRRDGSAGSSIPSGNRSDTSTSAPPMRAIQWRGGSHGRRLRRRWRHIAHPISAVSPRCANHTTTMRVAPEPAPAPV